MPNLADFNDQTRYNPRTAQANAQSQQVQHQQAVAENQAAGQVVERQAVQTPSPVLQQAQANTQGTYSLNTQTGQISGAQAGAMGKPGATGNPGFSNGVYDPNQAAKKAGDDAAGFYIRNNPGDVLGENKARQEAEKNFLETEAARLDVQGKQQQQEQGGEEENAAANAAGAVPQGDPGVNAAFAQLPEEAQFLAPFLQQFQQTMEGSMQGNQAMTQGLLQQNKQTYDQVFKEIAEMKAGYVNTSEAMQGLIEEVRDQNSTNLDVQKKAAEDRLAWDQQKMEREITKQKRRDRDSMVAQIALMGGFGQDAGIRAVMESDAVYDQKMGDLQIEFGVQRTELSAKFSALYNENQNNYLNKTEQNVKDLRAGLERIGMQSISSMEARGKAEQSIITKGWDTQVALRKELADKNLSVASKISDLIAEEKKRLADEKRQKRDDAWNFFKFSFDQSTDPALRQKAQSAMQEAGYDVSGIDLNALPVDIQAQQAGFAQQERMAGINFGYDVQLKQMDLLQKQQAATMYDPFQYTEPEKRSAMTSANVVTSKAGFTEADKAVHKDYVKRLLDSGDVDGANAYIVQLAEKQMNDGVRTTYNTQKTIMNSTTELLKDLKAIQKENPKKAEQIYKGIQKLDASDFNIYAKGLQNLRNKFGVDKDPELARIFARVENIAGVIINERYGAAVTDGELDRARQYIAMSGNTLGDMIIKLDEMNKTYAAENENLLSSYTGGVTDYGAPYQGEMPTDDDFGSMQNYGQSSGPVSFQDWQKSVGTGQEMKGSPYHNQGLDQYAIDIDGKKGDALPSPVSGTVTQVVKSNSGYGNYVVVTDDQGYEHLFGHLGEAQVQQGAKVQPGVSLGKIGNSGTVIAGPGGDGSHVHYRVTKDGKPFNPRTLKHIASHSHRS